LKIDYISGRVIPCLFELQIMQTQSRHRRCENAIPLKLQHGLAAMLEAVNYAAATNRDRWEFAVEIGELRKLGLSENDLRFLVRIQCVEHASEITATGNDHRRFRRTGDVCFTRRTCFVLTSKGIAAANGHPDEWAAGNASVRCPAIRLTLGSEPHGADQVPSWDTDRRTLFFGGQVVKRFRWRAINQEMILSAFQEEGWPARIDDPLCPSPSIDMKRRLSDTVKCLNRGQERRLLQFRGDGTGQGIQWEPSIPHGFTTDSSSILPRE
jgi:hypothetical protein